MVPRALKSFPRIASQGLVSSLLFPTVLIAPLAAHAIGGPTGYVDSPADLATVRAMPRPRISAVDVSGDCRNTPLNFENDRARAGWPAPGYAMPLKNWAMHYVKSRAGKSSPRCADLELSVKLWQSAIGTPITGRMSERDVAEFVRIVDAADPRYATLHQDGGVASGKALARRDARGRAAEHEAPAPESGRSGAMGARSGSVRLESVATLMGRPFEKVSQQLSSGLCRQRGQTIDCVKEDPCYNYKAYQAGTRQRSTPPASPPSAAQLGQNLLNTWAGMLDPRVEQARQGQNSRGLAECQARYNASPESRAEMTFAGAPVTRASLSFQDGVLAAMELSAGADDAWRQTGRDDAPAAIHRWLTSRMGKPKENRYTAVIREPGLVCNAPAAGAPPGACIPVSGDSVAVTEYDWVKGRERVHQKGSQFRFDAR